MFMCFSASQILFSQEWNPTIGAVEAIGELHNGDLLIQLKSERNRLNALELELQKGNEKYKEKVQKLMNSISSDRDSFNYNFIQSMKKYYNFSKVYFFYDYDTPELEKSGFIGGRFLNPDLKKGFSRPYSSRSIFILKQADTKEQSLDAFILFNKDNQKLTDPFPSTIRKNNLRTIRNAVFNKSMKNQLDAEYFAKKLQSSYSKFYFKKYKESLM
ncbi:MAG: hypothetical protein ABI851_15205 [Saprospiraceae bacterium]